MTPVQRAAVLRRRTSLDAQVQAALAGKKAVMFDMTDLSTLYQNTAYSPHLVSTFATPVTTTGQTVGFVADKSKSSVPIDVAGHTWTVITGDGALSVVGNQITITGATVLTRVARSGGNIPFSPGMVKMTVTATWSSATSVRYWLRGNRWDLSNGVSDTTYIDLYNSLFDAVEVESGTATFTINEFKYWEGYHAIQSTAGARPLLQTNNGKYCARFDGSNDLLSTPSIDFSASTQALFTIAFAANAWAVSIIAELGPNAASTNGSFYLSVGEGGAGYAWLSARSTAQDIVRNTNAISTGALCVLTVMLDLSQASALSKIAMLVNGASGQTTVQGDVADASANLINGALNIGNRASGGLPASCDVFALAMRGGSATGAEIALFDAWARSKVGI